MSMQVSKASHMQKKYYSWNPGSCICENSMHLKTIADISVSVCDECTNATDNVSNSMKNTILANMTNTIPTNVTSIMSTNSYDKKIRYKMDSYILYTILLVIILLFTIIF